MGVSKSYGISDNDKKIKFNFIYSSNSDEVYINCRNARLKEVIINDEDICYLFCQHNSLTEIRIPDGVRAVSCDYNNLKELNLPLNVQQVWCDRLLDYGNPRYNKKELSIEVNYETSVI